MLSNRVYDCKLPRWCEAKTHQNQRVMNATIVVITSESSQTLRARNVKNWLCVPCPFWREGHLATHGPFLWMLVKLQLRNATLHVCVSCI